MPALQRHQVRVIGVIDLLDERAVHARAGQRDRYAPVSSAPGSPTGEIAPGDAVALARAYVDRLGVSDLYVADLDAILGRPSNGATKDTLIAALAVLETPLWLDAGISSAEGAHAAIGLGATRIIVGLETLTSFTALAQICAAVGGGRVVFSLDLRNGEPIVQDECRDVLSGHAAHAIAERAVTAGAGSVIVLDLARVGLGVGLDFGVIAAVRKAAPGVMLLAGGGVGGMDDLRKLVDAGCDGALVATALHDGRLSATDIAEARRKR